MTYCLALRLDEGLVFLADTRTNAASTTSAPTASCTSSGPRPDRVFVLESAGSLATTQQVLDRIDHDLADPRPPRAWPRSATSSRRRCTSAG